MSRMVLRSVDHSPWLKASVMVVTKAIDDSTAQHLCDGVSVLRSGCFEGVVSIPHLGYALNPRQQGPMAIPSYAAR